MPPAVIPPIYPARWSKQALTRYTFAYFHAQCVSVGSVYDYMHLCTKRLLVREHAPPALFLFKSSD